MTAENMPVSGFAYNGVSIRNRSERLNLTDMWKASGSPSGRGPADWLALTSTAEFVEHVALIAGNPGNMLTETKVGRAGGTWSHWQIGLAYAKYLSPEFHMWCNTVVRERMEGKPTVPAVDVELIRRMDGICRMLANKVTGIEKASEGAGRVLELLARAMTEQDRRINDLILISDSRSAVVERTTVRKLLDDAGAEKKGRRSLNARLRIAMLETALQRNVTGCRRCQHSGVWLFPIDFADRCMAEFGREWVAIHNAEASRNGQGVLQFPRRRPKKKADDQASA